MSTEQPDLALLARSAPASRVPVPSAHWKTRVLLPLTIILAFAGLLGYAARDALLPSREINVVPVVVKRGGEVAAAVSFQAAGWVEPDPFPIYVSALTDGIVKEVLVLEGQPVKANQVIVRMVDDDARLSLRRAAAEVSRRRAEQALADAELKAATAQFKPGNRVDRNLALKTAESKLAEHEAELGQLVQNEARAKAEVDLLAEQLKREVATRTKNPQAVSEFTIIRTRLQLKAKQATLASVTAEGPILKARVYEQKSRVKAAQQHIDLSITETRALEVAKANLDRAKAEVAQAEAARDEAALRLERMNVRSPVSGVVMQRMSAPGSKLMLGMDGQHSGHAVHLYDPNKLQVRVDVPLADAAQVGVGQKCRIVVEVLPDRTFEGEVTRIVNEADVGKNTLQVKVSITDPDPALKPEMLTRVQFVAAKRESEEDNNALRVFAPESLLIKASGAKGAATTWIVDKGRGTALLRTVTIGAARYDKWVEITSGLQPGDQLIATDPSLLSEGLKVKVMGEARVR